MSTVFKVDPTGTLTHIAGIGGFGSSGDNGPANQAGLFLGDLDCDNVSGLAVDQAGNLYVADLGSGRIRKIRTDGSITTIAGTGAWDTFNDGIPALNADLGGLSGVAVDASGNVYISDTDPNTAHSFIHKILPDGTIHQLLNVSGYLQGSVGLVADPQGDVYISDYYGNRVYELTTDGTLHPIAGIAGTGAASGDGGPAISAQLTAPLGLALDAAGDLYIAEVGKLLLREITPDGIIHTVASASGPSGFYGATGVALDAAGNLIIADGGHLQIRKVSPGGTVTTLAGNGNCCFGGDGGPASQAQLNFYTPGEAFIWGGALATDPSGDLYVADTLNARVRKISKDGSIATVAGTGNQGITKVDGLPATQATLNYTYGVAADGAGNVYIGDGYLRKVAANGLISTLTGPGDTPLLATWGLTTDANDNLYDGLERIAPDGIISTVNTNIAGLEATNPFVSLYSAWAGATDASGDLYLADPVGRVVRKVAADGTVTVVAGTGDVGLSGDGGPATEAGIGEPTAIAVDQIGDLYIAACFNQQVRIVTPDGTISTIAGNGTLGYSGDGGAAIKAQLGCINGMAVDNAGNIYLSDQTYNAIRKLRWQPSGAQ